MGFSRVVSPFHHDAKRRKVSASQKTKETSWKGMEWIQCQSLRDALDVGLVVRLPRRKKRAKKTAEAPDSLEELETIMDDTDEE